MYEGGDKLAEKLKSRNPHREVFSGKFGFFISSLGSAIGMGNILIFPYMTTRHGGGAFILAYLILSLVVGITGSIGEMALGRAMRAGPVGSFKKALDMRKIKNGWIAGVVPIISALFIAITYSVTIGWTFYYTFGLFTGSIQERNLQESFYSISGDFKSVTWQLSGFFLAAVTIIFGIKKHIEKANKTIVYIMFFMLVFLIGKVFFLDNSGLGYQYLINVNLNELLSPDTWVFALGQTLFSLSIVGSGTIIYGSHLKKAENLLLLSTNIVLFDIISSIIMSLIIIPATFSFALPLNSGPPLLFSVIPRLFSGIPFGQILCGVFFFTILSVSITALINILEAPIELLQIKLNIPRKVSAALVLFVCAVVGLFIENINAVSACINIIYLYIAPICALISGTIFYVVCKRRFIKVYIQEGLHRTISKKFVPAIRFIFISVTLFIFAVGILFVRI